MKCLSCMSANLVFWQQSLSTFSTWPPHSQEQEVQPVSPNVSQSAQDLRSPTDRDVTECVLVSVWEHTERHLTTTAGPGGTGTDNRLISHCLVSQGSVTSGHGFANLQAGELLIFSYIWCVVTESDDLLFSPPIKSKAEFKGKTTMKQLNIYSSCF